MHRAQIRFWRPAPPDSACRFLAADRAVLVPRLVVFVHVAGVLALALMAVYTLGLHCEGFGCMDLGLMWMAWAVLFGSWLLFGLLSGSQSRKVSRGLVKLAALAVRAR